MAVVVAIYLQQIYGFAEWKMALFLSVVPTLIMFTGCFRFTGLVFPELSDSISYSIKKGRVIKYFIQERVQQAIDRINAS